MKKSTARWLGWALAALVLVLVASTGAIYWAASRLDIRAEIAREVERATGRALTIHGEVGVSFWPVIGLNAEQAELANVENGRAPALVSIDKLDVGVEIWPLLRGDLVIRRLVLEKPRLFLEVDETGAPNWILQPATTSSSDQETDPEAAPPQPPSLPDQPINLRMMRIVSGAASLYDARADETWVITDANLRTAIDGYDKPVNVAGDFVYRGETVEGDFELSALRAIVTGRPTPMRAELQSALMSANFEGEASPQSARVSGLVQASGPSLRRVAAWIGAPLQGGYGFAGFSISGHIEAEADSIAFSNAGFTLDDLRGRGDFEVSERAGKPYLSGRMELFTADFNAYLFGTAEAAEEESAVGAAAPAADASSANAAPARALNVQAPASDTPLDFSSLRMLNCDLELITHAMQMQQMRIDESRLGVVINDGYMIATLHELNFYGGSGRGRSTIDARDPANTEIVQELVADNIDAHAFLSDAANFSAIEGEAELSLSLRTHGLSQEDFINNADGEAHLEVIDGALNGVDLGGVARTIQNAMNGALVSPQARTQFTGFSATFALSDGVLASDNLSFNTPELVMRGVGVLDLNALRMDVRITPRSPRGGFAVPFAVRGPFADPDFSSDIADRALREISVRVREVQTAARDN